MNKGFIGAIGDDLPSLIPIFIALTIFFSVFLSTYNIYTDTIQKADLEQDALDIALTIKSKSVISDYNDFENLCSKVTTSREWDAFLVPLDRNIDNYKELNLNNYKDLILEKKVNNNTKKFICNNKDIEFFNRADNKKTYMFPITLQTEIYTVPVRLYIIVW